MCAHGLENTNAESVSLCLGACGRLQTTLGVVPHVLTLPAGVRIHSQTVCMSALCCEHLEKH